MSQEKSFASGCSAHLGLAQLWIDELVAADQGDAQRCRNYAPAWLDLTSAMHTASAQSKPGDLAHISVEQGMIRLSTKCTRLDVKDATVVHTLT
jgi:hypothetical protein